MGNEIPLPPIRATQPGLKGRKHTVGQSRLNAAGRIEVYLNCGDLSRCGCGGWYDLEELLADYQALVRQMNEEKVA